MLTYGRLIKNRNKNVDLKKYIYINKKCRFFVTLCYFVVTFGADALSVINFVFDLFNIEMYFESLSCRINSIQIDFNNKCFVFIFHLSISVKSQKYYNRT